MKNSLTKRQLGLAVAYALALGVVPGAAHAQSNGAQAPLAPAAQRALVTDSGVQVWQSANGECWHSGFGPAPLPSAECDPNYRPLAQAAAPAPRPIALAAATPAAERVVENVTLDADTLFDFDKAVLRPAGRSALDVFVGKLQGVDLEAITAVGHTDRIGSERYNQSLSDRRAQAVKTYLVAQGIQADRVHAEGVGETQPVTKAGECPGGKSARVIACLQPDRRVDVQVSGTRTTQ
ncbi:MAG TPA: OmpA family protein [Burkholderiales bacterium]|nr:OmpA family protein [Burkholderiales bacterium]